MLTSLSDHEAMHMALLLSQQENDFGINMYDAIRPQDEAELQSLIASGYTNEQAVLYLFEKRYVPHNPTQLPPLPPQSHSQSMYQTPPPAGYHQQPLPPPNPRSSQYIPAGGMYPEPQPHQQQQQHVYPPPVPRPPPQRQASMMPSPAPPMHQSQYGMLAAVSSPTTGMGSQQPSPGGPMTVVTAVPLNEMDVGMGGFAQADASTGRTHRRVSSGNSVSSATPAGTPSPAPAPPRTMHRQGSTATMGGASGDRPKLVKKRSIFNFTTRGSGADEVAPKPKYKESDVKTLTNMGYSREQAVWALLQNNNNLPMAIDALCLS